MRTVLTFILLSFCCFAATAQDVLPAQSRNKAVYAEFLGNGIGGSINFDTRLERGRQDGHGLRIGIGGFPEISDSDVMGNSGTSSLISVPISYNYLVGTRRSAFEAGAGISPLFAKTRLTDSAGGVTEGSGATVAGFLNAGYRYQPLNNGLVFRFTWTPAVTNEGFFPAWFGLSLGYGFK